MESKINKLVYIVISNRVGEDINTNRDDNIVEVFSSKKEAEDYATTGCTILTAEVLEKETLEDKRLEVQQII